MALWLTLALLCIASCFAAELPIERDRTICDVDYNNTLKIQCLCDKNAVKQIIKSADCYITTENINREDPYWDQFSILKDITTLTLSNARGKSLTYIPTRGLKKTSGLIKIDIKYNNIPKIASYAFANLTELNEIYIKDNKIDVLEIKAFAHHKKLTTIVLDKNNIAEINREVFINLPNLQKLYLTTNAITTIHDRAFINLGNLKLLEIDNNKLFSLNNETFSGLSNLEILDLSGNELEVIGDNTFLPLKNLRSLNLEANKLQVLDDKAFNGLGKLHVLTLANNKLAYFENVKVFEPLKDLTSLSLRENQLQELKAEVMAPILHNFYGANSSLDVEENNFPCDCRLEWFTKLLNKTKNKKLQIALENLKCTPDAKVQESYTKAAEIEKSLAVEYEQNQNQNQNSDYEYYDDTQLNGKLFYTDLRILMNCTNETAELIPAKEPIYGNKRNPIESKVNTILNNEFDLRARKEATNYRNADKPTEISEGKPNLYTTSRLATVSAKPISEKKTYDEREMAADEAKPDALRDQSKENIPGNAQRSLASVTFAASALIVRLIF